MADPITKEKKGTGAAPPPKGKAAKKAPPATSAAPAAPPPVHRKMIGSTGTSLYAGYFDEETLPALQGKAAYDVYDEMRRGDAQVKMMLSAIKNPLKSSTFRHEPKDDSDEAKKVADFLDWHWFKSPFVQWERWFSEVMTHLDFGVSVHEYTFTAYQHREHGLVHCVGGMGFRKLSTIERWKVTPDKGLVGIDQIAHGDTVKDGSQNVHIPVESLFVFTNEQEGDNWEGVSLLRAAYGPWFRKKHLLKMAMIGAEKAAIGVPVGTYSNASDDAQRAAFEAIMQSFVVHESSYLLAPMGYEIDVLKIDFDAEKLLALIAYEDAQMTRSILFHFLELGQNGNGGAFSLGSDLSDMALAALQFIASGICEKMFKINERLVEWNFGDPDLTPQTVCVGINQKAGADFATAIKAMVDSKVITPDDKLEAHVRDAFNLPASTTPPGADRSPPPPPSPFGGGGGKPPFGGKGGDDEEELPAKGDDEEDEEDPPAKKPSAGKFSEAGAWVPFRALTLYEQPLNFTEMAQDLDDGRMKVSSVMTTRLAGLVDYVLRTLEQRFAQGPASRLKVASRLTLESGDYEKALLRAMAQVVALGTRSAARDLAAKTSEARFADDEKSIKSNLEFLPKHVQDALKLQAQKQAKYQTDELKKIVDMTVMSGDETRLPDNEIISTVEDRLYAYIESGKIESAARTVASQSFNRGRDGFMFDERNLRQIAAFQYSAVLDSATTDICLSLDGKIFKTNDPAVDRFRPPNHHGCRSILVPITVNEAPPTMTGLDMDPTNPSLIAEYERRGTPPPDLAKIKKSRNL